MADIGSLVVKLAADTAEFQADLGRSARLLDKHASDMKASLQQVAGVARTAFAVVIGTTSVAALRDFVTQTLETSAALQGLAEQTGASASALSGFAPVATISGTAMDAIGGSLAKLSKGLAGVDDETAGATKALQFLGIRAKDASGNLRDPAEVMNDVALKLSEFEDGAGKTALAMELFGKSGASMLPFLKDLAENQDLNIRLTAQQIEEADNASKALARMKAETGFVAQTLVTAAIPSMTVLAQELKQVLFGTQDAVGGIQRLRTEGSLTTWAQNTAYAIAVVIDALRGIGQTIKSVIGSFQAVWADIELAGTFLAGGEGLNPFSEENRARLKAALDKRNAIVEQANQNYVELWDMPLLADAVTKRFDDIRKGTDASNSETTAPASRKRLNYSTATTAVTASAMAGIDSELKRLQGLVDTESGSRERLARAFNVNLSSINRRINLLEGICPEAIDLLQDKQFTPDVTRILRNMKAARQVEAVELMVASNTITVAHAEALLKATLPEQRADLKPAEKIKTAPMEQLVKLEKEMSQVQSSYREAESTYGSDLLNLVVAKGYLTKLLANEAVKSYIHRHEPEILEQFELVVNTVSMEEAVQQQAVTTSADVIEASEP